MRTQEFDNGFYGAEDKRDSAYQHQPTPFGLSQMMLNNNGSTAGNPSVQPEVQLPQPTAEPRRPQINEETLRKGMEILRKYKRVSRI